MKIFKWFPYSFCYGVCKRRGKLIKKETIQGWIVDTILGSMKVDYFRVCTISDRRYNLSPIKSTDKRTDVWSRDFMIWRINFGLWAVAWAD